jgi:hypothetical protein
VFGPKHTFDRVQLGTTLRIDQVGDHVVRMLYWMYLVLVPVDEETGLPDSRKFLFGQCRPL